MKNYSKHTMFLMVAVLATCLFSCTKGDDEKANDTSGQSASASLSLKTEVETPNLTGRDVERGSLHAWIKDINVHASAMELIRNRDFSFTLVPDGTAGAAHDFVMDGLAIGRNDFTISTTTSTLPILVSTRHDVNPVGYMDAMKARNPYAIYSATTTANIVYGQNNTVTPTVLRTQNGRHIALFKLGDALAALGVRAKVTPIINGVTKTALEFDTELLGHVYWSDADCTAGKTIQYNIRLFKPNGQPLMDDHNTEVGFTTLLVTIQASTSINRIYTVTKDNLTENTSTQLFTAEEWNNDDNNNNTINIGG